MYKRTITEVIMLSIACVLWFMCGISIGNSVRQDYLKEQAQETLDYCYEDIDVDNCRIEWQYEGMILTGFEVVGQGA